MPAEIKFEPNDVCVLRINGVLKESEFQARQSELAREFETGITVRLLAILEDFQGWEWDADWDDLEFLFSHSGKITKIAIVAEQRWEMDALAFAGAGIRSAPVKLFPPNELAKARQWL